MNAKCVDKGHKFRKFDDESLFCNRCGERRIIAQAPVHYCTHQCNHWHWHPYGTGDWWPIPYTIWSGTTTGTISISGTTMTRPDQYTLT